MGSEMCIRDRSAIIRCAGEEVSRGEPLDEIAGALLDTWVDAWACLLYTSDAADERSSVDLGGRRIIKQNKQSEQQCGCVQ